MASVLITPPRRSAPAWVRAFAVRAFCHVRVTTFPALPSRPAYNRYIPASGTTAPGGHMSQQYPQQPGQFPQQQPGWGAPTQPGWGTPPPKKRSVGKIVGLGCAGVFGFIVVITVIAAVATSGGSKSSSSGASGTVSSSSTAKAAGGGTAKAKTSGSKAADTVVFKVWGTAPAGALGGLDIQYGSDSDTRKGAFHNGKFTASLPFKSDAMYYQLNAQLQGSGDINCSVTVGGKTKAGHASGGFNICMAQLSSGVFGDWS